MSCSSAEASKLTQREWVEYTKQIWRIPIPNKSDLAFGEHSAIMPEEIVNRAIRLYSMVDDLVLDPFTGSGTTLRAAKKLSAGCAIGLGNVWKFPYLAGANGGAAFILIYLVFLLILGIPIMTAEFAVGRGSQLSAVKAFRQLQPEGTQ